MKRIVRYLWGRRKRRKFAVPRLEPGLWEKWGVDYSSHKPRERRVYDITDYGEGPGENGK
jgi:hypothetical protein